MARGSRSHDDHQESKAHVQMVQSQASAAVVYLEEQFESRNSHIRALTSKGSVLDTITFRSEETTEGVRFNVLFSVEFTFTFHFLGRWALCRIILAWWLLLLSPVERNSASLLFNGSQTRLNQKGL